MIKCQTDAVYDHKDPFEHPLISILIFKRERQQVQEEVDSIQIEHRARIEHHATTHNSHKRGKIDIRKHRSIKQVKENAPCRIQEHDQQKTIDHHEILVRRILLLRKTENAHSS